ncbi:hypothetical protein BJ994_001635 [Arthrobacter pigmenti]|uniref:Uncharacterized protein n=1 Tax=Arthrobacter pigmenti TaxID=271432 RepID=A0A846RN82_9MICC|nr:hypothetical protein [Arthrobacter pigmenti]
MTALFRVCFTVGMTAREWVASSLSGMSGAGG